MTATKADLNPADFDFIRDLIRRESAIVLEPGKEYLAENRLHPLIRRHEVGSITEFVAMVRNGSRELVSEVVDALTTNETSFFRDGHPWEALKTVWLPELIQKRQAARTLNVWFAAASSGQEPYSFAMTLKEHFAAETAGWRIRLIGTDISPTMLRRSKEGVYSQLEVNRGLPAQLMVRYFDREGLNFVADPSLRSMFEFEQLNLADVNSWSWLPTMDLIFCRNVLIYFDVPTKQEIFRAMHRQLAPDGLLMLGSSETTISLTDDFDLEKQDKSTCYRPR